MLRKIAAFYLLAMLLAFVTTLFLGARGQPPQQIMLYALLAWPLAAMLQLAWTRAQRMLHQARARD